MTAQPLPAALRAHLDEVGVVPPRPPKPAPRPMPEPTDIGWYHRGEPCPF